MENSRKKANENTSGYNHQSFSQNMEEVMQLWPQIIEKISQKGPEHYQNHESLAQQITQAFLAFQDRLLREKPDLLTKEMSNWWQQSLQAQQEQWLRFMHTSDATHEAPEMDRRFRDDLWQSSPYYENLKQQYQLSTQWFENTFAQVKPSLPDNQAKLIDFYSRQWRDAMAPSNYPWSNPEVLKQAIETNGESLVSGLKNLLHDLEQGRITMAPKDAFTLGKDIACTPGKVVYENELMQLIQYEATTEKVQKTPLLIVPAWINKYYILDLRPENSLVKWMTDQGFTVFIISWVNPGEAHQHITFDDYLMLGAWEAVQTVLDITGEESTHITGYCLGGTLTSCLLAWLKARGEESAIRSATYLTTLTDFEQAGDLKLFVDEPQLEAMEKTLDKRGYLEGNEMAAIFNALRPQDLIWSFVVNNYLLGKPPFSFDLLYWNGDVTRMPAKMHLFYLREMYLHNSLAKGELTLSEEKIDLTQIDTPTYMLATEEDHIAPWKATYAATQFYQGETRFVLSGSGHIAGVVNPPHKKKYYWRSNDTIAETADEWLEHSKQQEGSWWNDWKDWLVGQDKRTVDARKIKHAIEDAPGSYVQVRA